MNYCVCQDYTQTSNISNIFLDSATNLLNNEAWKLFGCSSVNKQLIGNFKGTVVVFSSDPPIQIGFHLTFIWSIPFVQTECAQVTFAEKPQWKIFNF